MRRRAGRVAAALLAGLLGAGAIGAQTLGTLEGEVRDSAGGALVSVDVIVSSPSLQGARTTRTDDAGRYRLPGLPPGTYTVTATAAGFHPEARSVAVSLSGRASVVFSLQPAVAETVSVSGESPRIDLGSTAEGSSFTARVIERLPVDRNYADIVRANPGVATDQGQTMGRALALTVYGATSAENQFAIDGVNTTNVAQGIQTKLLNNEFVQEVNVQTGGYPAEYGGALGGVVNVVTKSGGNAYHGSGFAYFDSNATAAAQKFTDRDATPVEMRWADYRRIDYGADLGGYLLKDRLWFFAAYNRVDFDGHVSRVVDAPPVLASMRFPIDSADDLYSGKLTWNAAPSTSIVGTIFADPTRSSGASGADPRQDPQIGRLEDTAIQNPDSSTWSSSRRLGGIDFAVRATQLFGANGLVSLQVGRHEDRNSLAADDQVRTLDLTCPSKEPLPCAPPESPNGVEGGFGIIDALDQNDSFRNQGRLDATFYRGAHELKAGVGYEYGGSTGTYSGSGGQEVEKHDEYGPIYYWHRYAAVSFSGQTPTPTSGAHIEAKARSVGVYLQDSWMVSAGLTINAGLRWNHENLLTHAGSPAFALGNEWQPRLGIAWDPWKNGRTKLSAFAGRFSYSLPTLGAATAFHDYAGVLTYNFSPTSIEQDPSAPGHQSATCWAGCGATGEGTDPHAAVDAHLLGTYQDELSVGLQRMLDPTLTVGVRGTYRRLGNAVEDRCDFAIPPADAHGTFCAIINPGSGEKYASGDAETCNGAMGDNDWQCTNPGPATPPARRLYRAVEVSARKTVGTSLWLQASYVYSSLRGNYDGAVNESFLETTPGLNSDFNYPGWWHNAYGRPFLDRPHRFRFDGYWVTPWRIALGLQAFALSGAPENRLGVIPNLYILPRGSAGRMPTQWDSNLTLSYPIVVGPATVTLQAFVFDLFDNQSPLTRDDIWTTDPNYPGHPGYNPDVPKDVDSSYGLYLTRQNPRTFRAAVRVSF